MRTPVHLEFRNPMSQLEELGLSHTVPLGDYITYQTSHKSFPQHWNTSRKVIQEREYHQQPLSYREET